MLRFMRPQLRLFLLSMALSWLIVALEAVYLWVPASLVKTLFSPEDLPIGSVGFSFVDLNAYLKGLTYRLQGSGDPYRGLTIICALLMVTSLVKNVATYIQALVVTRVNLNMIENIRHTLFRHILKLPMTYFDRHRSGSVMTKVLNDVGLINTSIMTTVEHAIIEPIRILAFLTLMVVISPPLTLIVLTIYPLLIFGIDRIGRSVRRRSSRMLANLSGLMSVLNETIYGLRAVKMFNRNRQETAKFQCENHAFIESSYRASKVRALGRPVTDTLGALLAMVLLLVGGRMVLNEHNDFTAEDFMRFLVLLLSMYRPIKAITQANMSLQAGLAAAQRVFETQDEEPEPLRSLRTDRVPPFREALALRHVTFRYPGHDTTVLDDVSFVVPKGQVVALVGPSGSGKSTIIDCIPRFYPLAAGAILLDGVDVATFDLVGYRHLFGIVSQETILFNDTVRGNIAFGVEAATDDQVAAAAEQANAMDFIRALPKGMDTIVGERGVMLSGGQQQRIAIARALLKNPPILLLDEATSALDSQSEREVQRAILTLMKDRTTVVVAHRLSTIRHANRILVLEKGRIVETGHHDELMTQNGRYRYYHDIQFADPQRDAPTA